MLDDAVVGADKSDMISPISKTNLMYNIEDFLITKTSNSRINQINLEDPGFGKFYTDHMLLCDYKNGEWQKPEIKPYGPMELEPASKIFHYGQSIFEGMKAFKNEHGDVSLFRPDQNVKRFNKSCQRMCMPEFPEEYFFGAIDILMNLDKDWISSEDGFSLYIRPFAIGIENQVAASPSTEYRVCIICSPVKAYYADDHGFKVLVQDKYSRSADGGVGFVKAGGNYGSSFYPTQLAKKKGYQQIIWTDSDSHQYMEEAGTMNVFFRINDTLITAPTNDRILDGVTRKSIIQLAKDHNINVEIRRIKVTEILEAAEKGELKEIFGSGTAATVVKFIGFGYKDVYHELPKSEVEYGLKLKKALQDIQYNRVDDNHNWIYKVKPLNKLICS